MREPLPPSIPDYERRGGIPLPLWFCVPFFAILVLLDIGFCIWLIRL